MEYNRFAAIGNPMASDSYVHRENLEKKLLDRTVNYSEYGSINVIGLNRMGKSSLVYNTLEAKAEEFYKQNIVVVKITAREDDSADQFFKSIAKHVYKEMKKHQDLNDEIQEYYDDFTNENIEKDGPDNLEFYFESIKDSGKRVVCIVDEFDSSVKIFADYPEGFNILRQLAYEPETHVSFVFISTRPAEDLESRSEGISPFHNILDYLFVKGYSEEEMEEYYKCNEESGVVLSDEEKKKLMSITGGQPYWSDIILKAYKEAKDNGEDTDIETIFNQNKDCIYAKYQEMLNSIDRSLLNKFSQFVSGSSESDYTRSDIQRLYNYGIIVDRDNLKVISEKFDEYCKEAFTKK